MSQPMRVIQVGVCRVFVWSASYIETAFPDGRTCPALLVEDPATRALAEELGYGTDVRRMHIEHEITHTVLAQLDGHDWSPVLYHVAGGTAVPDEIRANEEARVIAVQRALARIRPLSDAVCAAMDGR